MVKAKSNAIMINHVFVIPASSLRVIPDSILLVISDGILLVVPDGILFVIPDGISLVVPDGILFVIPDDILLVIPAHAGIQFILNVILDSSLRWRDKTLFINSYIKLLSIAQ